MLLMRKSTVQNNVGNAGGSVRFQVQHCSPYTAADQGCLMIADCQFVSNQATGLSAKGGALSITDNYLHGQDVPAVMSFSDDIINAGRHVAIVRNTTFISNQMPGGALGGSIYVGPRMSVLVADSMVDAGGQNNKGGAMAIEDTASRSTNQPRGSLTIDNCIIRNTRSLGDGGALFAMGATGNNDGVHKTLIVSNTTIINNLAVGKGGAISLQGANGEVDKNTRVFGNRAQSRGGAFSASPNGAAKSRLTVKDSFVNRNNAETSGGAVYLEFRCEVNLTHTHTLTLTLTLTL